jgi:hypothetical protein
MSDKAIDDWTTRLLTLAPGLGESTAHDFVREVYEGACRDLDAERSEADFEREE